MPIDISIIIVSREKRELLSRSLDSLINQSYSNKNFEIIVVDDGSEKEDLYSIVLKKKKFFPNLKYVKQDPIGLSAGRNLGVKNASAKIVAFTDNDVIVSRTWVKEITSVFVSGVIGVEGRIITDYPRELFTNAPENIKGGLYIGANSAYLKKIVEEAGGYNEKMGFWREDTDFAFRAMKFGKIVFAEKAEIYHPLRKDSPLLIFRYLSFLRNEWLMFIKYPLKFQFFMPTILNDLFRSFFAFVAIFFAIYSFLISEYIFFSEIFFIFYFFIVLYPFLFKKLNVNTGVFGIFNMFLFLVLTFVKDAVYYFFLIYGFFDALVFMVKK